MSYRNIAASVGLLAAIAVVLPEPAVAQSRGRAVPRGSGGAVGAPPVRGGAAVRGGPRGPAYPVARHGGPVYAAPRHGGPHYGGRYPYYGRAYYGGYYGYGYPYHASVNFGFFFGYPGFYGAYAWGNPYWAPYGYAPYYGAYPYGYGYSGYGGRPYGGVRIDLPERNAEVFVDGYFVGIVNDFDGKLQQANLEAGPHRIEVRNQGFEPISFEVNVEPGRTVTYRAAAMKPAP